MVWAMVSPVASESRCCRILLVLFFTFLLVYGQGGAAEIRLEVKPSSPGGWPGIQGKDPDSCEGCPPLLYRLEASTNLLGWQEIAVLHDAPFTFFDPHSASLRSCFYRIARSPRDQAVDDWKNQVTYKGELAGGRGDTFLYYQFTDMPFVKFAIYRSDLTRVYFQEPLKYPLHYDFATARLPGFVGISRSDFDRVSLYTNNQELILGTVLLPRDLPYPHHEGIFDYGIQFVANDPLSPDLVRDCFRLVQSAIASPVALNPFYVPSPLQAGGAAANATFFASNSIPLTTVERWLSTDTIYSEGWALGTLKFVPGSEVNAAYFDGRLQPEDILLTDVVPPEVPFVAGIICLNAATPSSHVAVLSQAYKIPFAFVHAEPLRSRLLPMAGRRIVFVASATDGVKVLDIQGTLEPALETEILRYKQTPQVNIRPKEHAGVLSASVTNLVPSDARYFGGKAANYGLLTRIIPTNSPTAIAFSMDLWEAFMDQTVFSGRTLRAEISNRLHGLNYSPTNLVAIQNALSGIRSLIRNGASFSAEHQAAILSAISGFPSNQNIRFRSSSNAEDAESFTAAGLLDSYSGCVADDTDSDTTGPSVCDGSETNERGVFRAIQRVYASFYNDNAYLERARHGIKEAEAGVGILVHSSFPDATELANGVATVELEMYGGRRNVRAKMVTQPGAASVTNPSDDARPEVALTFITSGADGIPTYSFGNFFGRSGLLPQGITALTPADYEAFSQMFYELSVGYHDLFPAKNSFTLDFEYKKLTNGWRLIKQVREIPPAAATNVAPYLINQPTEMCVLQGESAPVVWTHSTKLRGTFETRNIQLSASNLTQHFFTAMHFEYYSNGVVGRFDAAPADLSNIVHVVEGNRVTDIIPATSSHPEFRFRMEIPGSVNGNLNPFVTLQNLNFSYEATNDFGTQSVRLGTCPVITTNSLLQVREFSADVPFGFSNSLPVTVRSRYYWPDTRGILASANTAPLVDFVETTIIGLTTDPIILTGHFSQSYGTYHHNLVEDLLFEPALDPSFTTRQREELSALRVRKILLRVTNPDRNHSLERSYSLETDSELNDD